MARQNPMDIANLVTHDLVDISTELEQLNRLTSACVTYPLVSAHLADGLRALIASLEHASIISSPPSSPEIDFASPLVSRAPSPLVDITPDIHGDFTVLYDVQLNRKTRLERLYRYPLDSVVEYPETSRESDHPIGHLFAMDPENWRSPMLDIVYSRGAPTGGSKKGEDVYVEIMRDKHGEAIPCVWRHTTCQGVKACPFVDRDTLVDESAHTQASRDDVVAELASQREARLGSTCPERDVLEKTNTYLTALRRVGCGQPAESSDEEDEMERRRAHRGNPLTKQTCRGRLLFEYDAHHKPRVRCEYYDFTTNRNHLCSYAIGDGSFDVSYVEAVLTDDVEEIRRIEDLMLLNEHGPLVECRYVTNHSTQSSHCPFSHRDGDGKLITQPPLTRLACVCRFRVYEPLPEYRARCPYILLVTKGPHQHPIPVPIKTPQKVRGEIMRLLLSMADDLPDMTPRRFLRHPSLKAYLASAFPQSPIPTLGDLHVSLANRAHLNSYIIQSKLEVYPFGTDWDGVAHLMETQSQAQLKELCYVRRMIRVRASQLVLDPDDELEDHAARSDDLLLIVCMFPEGSRRASSAQYMQSDIGHKRLSGGYKEFVMAALDRDANTSVVFCRAFVNRQTAHAHKLIFDTISEIILEDTGRPLRWRHIDAVQSDDSSSDMILQWTVDQHKGQAKGLGLHLQALVSRRPPRQDLHEPWRTLQDLSPYDHLHRVLRICVVHVFRKIKTCAVPNEVKTLMRSLVCLQHPNWEGTIAAIRAKGGKAANDWLVDKEQSRFVFEGICLEKSHIPEPIWRAGERHTNLIESTHSDANREGTQCALLGGIRKGMSLDMMKIKTLRLWEELGVRPSYNTVHPIGSTMKNLKRLNHSRTKMLQSQDAAIIKYNTSVEAASRKVLKAHNKVTRLRIDLLASLPPHRQAQLLEALQAAEPAIMKAEQAYLKIVEKGSSFVGTGSGQVTLLLPPTT